MPYKNPNAQCTASKMLVRDSDKVIDLYENQKVSMRDLAAMYDTSIGVVQYFFKVYDVQVRHHTDRPHFKMKKTMQIWDSRHLVEKMYVEDMLSTIDLGKHFGVSSDTITKILKEHGIKIRGYTGKKTQQAWEHVVKIIELYTDQKLSRVEIGKRYNCSHKTIQHILEENDIDLRSFSNKVEVQLARTDASKIKDLYTQDKLDLHEISDRYNIAYSTCRKILVEQGVDIVVNISKSTCD